MDRSEILRMIAAREIDFSCGQLDDDEMRELHSAHEQRIQDEYATELKRRASLHKGFVGGMI